MTTPCAFPRLVPLVFLLSVLAGPAAAGVSAREEIITLPTYLVAPADPHPRFYSGRTYQGAKATFYPYPVSDQMTEQRAERAYRSVVLENDYIRFSVVPELGGRIFTAVDKGNNYDFFYRQRVIKPALIGMLGAWISGGVEWNIPHHHRASSFMPVDYRLESAPDGSATVWVGETELRHRLKWLVGMTLRPDRSFIEMTVKVFNRTPIAHSFLFWINPAVHANEHYQVIFPPSVQWTVQHGKPEFASWPVARQRYGGQDYTAGVDISWWKNHAAPVSFFAWNCREDFFGGYDHGRRAGVAHVANHHVSPGKKFFEWGNGPEGEMWTRILSDDDDPYLELMAGSFSDNQPDYSWLQPSEVKVFKHYWYPIRDLGGIKNANTEAALNLERSAEVATLRLNSTGELPGSRLRVALAGQMLVEETIALSPRHPVSKAVVLPPGARTEDIRATLLDAEGREVISYQPRRLPETPMPAPARRPTAPREIQTSDELYYTGQRIEQLYSPSFDPEPYYREILARDPLDYRANTALGGLYCRQGRWVEAESHLRVAVLRSTENYLRPQDCEAHYYLGVALRAEGRILEARDEFYRATWDHAWKSAAHLALSELAARQGDFEQALELAQSATETAALNPRAHELRAALLRRLGRLEAASQAAAQILQIDPLNFFALNELRLLATVRGGNAASSHEQLLQAMRTEGPSFLELATDYANAGMRREAMNVLELYLDQAPRGGMAPMAHYYLAAWARQESEPDRATRHLQTAARLPTDYCFPFQHAAEPALFAAIEQQPQDARARYYLGCLLYDQQPSRALALWREAVELEPAFAAAHRALGNGLAQTAGTLDPAIRHLERALEIAPQNARWHYELDVLYEAAGAPVDDRLRMLERYPDVVALRDDATTRRIALLTAAGRPREAVDILLSRPFHNWEGSSALHSVHVDACVQAGLMELARNRFAEAARAFQTALEYPPNQQVGAPAQPRVNPVIEYLLGVTAASQGQAEAATAARARAAAAPASTAEAQFFKALALAALKREEEARNWFTRLEASGRDLIAGQTEAPDYFAKFGERQAPRVKQAQGHYLIALGALGLGRRDVAAQEFAQTLELHPAHLGALMWSKAALGGPKPAWWLEGEKGEKIGGEF